MQRVRNRLCMPQARMLKVTCLKRSLSEELLTDTFSSCAYASSQASLYPANKTHAGQTPTSNTFLIDSV